MFSKLNKKKSFRPIHQWSTDLWLRCFNHFNLKKKTVRMEYSARFAYNFFSAIHLIRIWIIWVSTTSFPFENRLFFLSLSLCILVVATLREMNTNIRYYQYLLCSFVSVFLHNKFLFLFRVVNVFVVHKTFDCSKSKFCFYFCGWLHHTRAHFRTHHVRYRGQNIYLYMYEKLIDARQWHIVHDV